MRTIVSGYQGGTADRVLVGEGARKSVTLSQPEISHSWVKDSATLLSTPKPRGHDALLASMFKPLNRQGDGILQLFLPALALVSLSCAKRPGRVDKANVDVLLVCCLRAYDFFAAHHCKKRSVYDDCDGEKFWAAAEM